MRVGSSPPQQEAWLPPTSSASARRWTTASPKTPAPPTAPPGEDLRPGPRPERRCPCRRRPPWRPPTSPTWPRSAGSPWPPSGCTRPPWPPCTGPTATPTPPTTPGFGECCRASPGPTAGPSGRPGPSPPRPWPRCTPPRMADIPGGRQTAGVGPAGLLAGPGGRRPAVDAPGRAARRSEAAALAWGDVEFQDSGSALLSVRRSKTDPTAEGVVPSTSGGRPTSGSAGHPARPAAAGCRHARLRALAPPDRPEGACRRPSPPAWGTGYTGHSGRVGMAQDLARSGVELPALMTAGRWKSSRMPARYTERQAADRGAVARYYQENAGATSR